MKARLSKSAALLIFSALYILSSKQASGRESGADVRKADIVLSIRDSKSFDIGLGRLINGKREPIYFPLEKLIGFLRRERQKNLILISSARAGLVNDKLKNVLHSVGFRNIVTSDQNADEIFAARRRMLRTVDERDSAAKYHGTREIEAIGKADQLTLNIGIEVKSPRSSEVTQVVSDFMFSRVELLPFLQQDVQRRYLLITVPKNFSPLEGEELKTFALKSNFAHFEIEPVRGFFKDIPVPLR